MGEGEAPVGAGALQPRVVILARQEAAEVEVLQLPPDAAAGSRFRHGEAWWRVTSVRPSSRVLFAEPAEA